MKTSVNILISALFTLLAAAQPDLGPSIKGILASEYEYTMISSGNNYPGVDLQKDHLGEICILLHSRVSLDRIRAHFHWSEQNLENRLQMLLQEGLVKRDGPGHYHPTAMVIRESDARELTKNDDSVVGEAVRVITEKLPEIHKLYRRSPTLKAFPFQDASLLILSDVLLDNWQINAVEERFLRAERTLRSGKHYYYAILEKQPASATEAFGIYGNSLQAFGNAFVGLYGNRRQGLNFHTLSAAQLADLFGGQPPSYAYKFKEQLVREFLRASGDAPHALTDAHRRGFEQLGWLKDGSVAVPILRAADLEILSAIAALLTNDLLALLEKNRDALERAYTQSNYADEVTFQEYAIWWYHFFYTEVTQRLIAKGLIIGQHEGVFTYLVAD